MGVAGFFATRFADEVRKNGEDVQSLSIKLEHVTAENGTLKDEVKELKAQLREKDVQYHGLDKRLAIIETK